MVVVVYRLCMQYSHNQIASRPLTLPVLGWRVFLLACFFSFIASAHQFNAVQNHLDLPEDIYNEWAGNSQMYQFGMLNDNARNAAYGQALKEVITGRENSTVIDLGAGTMLLSMTAKRLGAASVVAIEKNKKMLPIAETILRDNGFVPDEITIVQANSYDVQLGSEALPRSADILVSETLDSWMIEEGWMHAVWDAKRRGLVTPDAIIVPARGILYAQLVETTLSLPSPAIIEGFKFETFRKFRPLDKSMMIDPRAIKMTLSQPQEVFHFDFQNIDTSKILEGYTLLNMTANRHGSLHGIMFWFKVYLTETITLSNYLGSGSHWPPVMHFIDNDIEVNEGDEFQSQIVHTDEKYYMSGDVIRENKRLLKVMSNCEGVKVYFVQEQFTGDATMEQPVRGYVGSIFGEWIENGRLYIGESDIFDVQAGSTIYALTMKPTRKLLNVTTVSHSLDAMQVFFVDCLFSVDVVED